MKKILVVGQTPPPYGGQAMMTYRLINAELKDIRIYHVRMAFSDSMASRGRAGLGKILHMFSVVFRTIIAKYRFRIDIIYYMPVGNSLNPLLRDICILMIVRRFFSKTIFHFRAAGVSEFVKQQNRFLKKLAFLSYDKPDLAIQLSSRNPNDGKYFHASHTVVIWNGLEDVAQKYLPINRKPNKQVTILYVGIIGETKGIWILLNSIRILRQKKYEVKLNVVGDVSSELLRQNIDEFCRKNEIDDIVTLPGVKSGDALWKYYADADIFCFPSFFESESFGNVAVEAMMFELPVVATLWRGIPDIVCDGHTGLLIPIKSPEETASALEKLITNYDMRIKMGKAGRQRFLQYFQIDKFTDRMNNQLAQV